MSETATATPSASSAPAPSAAPSAPATSGAPTATPSRPQSFSDSRLNWKPDAPASPAGSPSEPAQPASATTGADPTATPTPGPIPFDRHKSILDGAYKERDQYKTQFEQIRQQVESPDGQRLRQWAQAFTQNPGEWFGQTIADLAASRPDLIPALRSQAARVLAQRSQEAQSFEPDIPVYNEQGQMVAQTFSANKVQQIITHAIAEALQKEVSPLKQDFQTRQQQDEVRQIQQEALQSATSQFDAAKEWPGFLVDAAKGTVDPDLVKTFQEHEDWSLERCYIASVVPKLRAKEQAQVLDDLQTKAAASTGVNPANAAVSTSSRITSFNDKRLKW